MKFTELKRALTSNIEPIYICFGDDRMLKEIALQHITDACNISVAEFDIAYFDDKTEYVNIFESLNTLPFASGKRLTILKDYNINTIKTELVEYAKSPTPTSVLVITTAEAVDIKNIVCVDCNRLDKSILAAKITRDLAERDCTIDNDALSALIDFCDNDLGRITQEAFKLSSNKKIVLEDIVQNTAKESNYNVFALTEALGKKDANQAVKILDNLLQNDNGRGLLSTIYNHFHRLFFIAINPSLSDEQIALQLGVKSYAVKVSRPQVKYFGAKRLKQIIEMVGEADLATKSTWASIESNAYCIVLNILLK